ncbi:hypothetical protein PN498_27430 [Oscillatoria sp. CS-180]|uniref:hypothetical protein n=1 Tax=Oscillatoria sp. CS-180 TaxID=3021720 RepID=UPI00232D49F6|nr:hypothetical protein [Oscillatoria sp. CS-180]MDB9529751.1 hypothetical protein [Oscillatoria sp. CS-180]
MSYASRGSTDHGRASLTTTLTDNHRPSLRLEAAGVKDSSPSERTFQEIQTDAAGEVVTAFPSVAVAVAALIPAIVLFVGIAVLLKSQKWRQFQSLRPLRQVSPCKRCQFFHDNVISSVLFILPAY